MSMKCIIMEEAIKIAKQREDMSVVTKEHDPKYSISSLLTALLGTL